MSVAIIGAGPSGLIAAKEALECGLKVTLYEKESTIGGLWKPNTGSTWDSLRTNISKETCNISDFPWKEGVGAFPSRGEVYEYLCSYADAFKIHPHVRLNTEVQRATRAQDKWTVETLSNGHIESETFDFVINASGIFAKAHTPQIPGMETFKGPVLHAKDYKSPEPFAGKTVAVIGNAFSGCEICADLAKKTDRVVNVLHKPMWILPRYLPNQTGKLIPADLVFYSRAGHARSVGIPDDIVNQRKNAWFRGLCAEQAQVCNELAVTRDDKDPPFVTITDGYLDQIKDRHLRIKVGDIQEIRGNALLFRDGSSISADALIFATGYRADVPFLDAQTQALMGFIPEDQMQPFLMYQAMFPKGLPGMACVGMYRGPFFGVMELQARVASMTFSNKIPRPTEEEIQRGIDRERKIREANPRPQFSHGAYVGFCEELATMIGARPDFDLIEATNPDLFKKLWSGPFSTASYRLTGFGSKPDLAMSSIEKTWASAQ